MTDQLDLLKLVARRLDAAGIPYMLTGSLALSYYAVPRFTRDVDLVVQIGLERVDETAALFADDFYADADALRRAVTQQGMVNMIHQETLTKVDLIIQKQTPYHVEEFARRHAALIEGTPIWIVSPEDLVISKLSWLQQGGSDVHRQDIAVLLEALDTIDRGYIEARVRELHLADLWKELAA